MGGVMVKKIERVSLRCTACNSTRGLKKTRFPFQFQNIMKQFAKGDPFCPKCGNKEVAFTVVKNVKG